MPLGLQHWINVRLTTIRSMTRMRTGVIDIDRKFSVCCCGDTRLFPLDWNGGRSQWQVEQRCHWPAERSRTQSQKPGWQYSLFIRRYSRSTKFIILSKNNWSLLPLCFILSLESAPFVSSSTSFWYQFFHFRLTYSFAHHFLLFWFTTLYIYNSISLSFPA